MPSSIPRKGHVHCQDLNIHFETWGAGAPMLLAHGWGADTHSNWLDTGWIDALSPYRTIIGIDLRGHGLSSKPHTPAPYGYADMSDDVMAVLDQLDIARCDFMGYSMGAFIGAALLGSQSHRFTRMILGGIGDETAASAAQGAVIAQALRQPGRTIGEPDSATALDQFVDASPNNDREALACSAEQMWPQGYPLRLAGEGIGQADLPVLVVNGSEDHPYVDSADRFVSALPNATHCKIEGTDHLTTVTHPGFKQAVLQFLDVGSSSTE